MIGRCRKFGGNFSCVSFRSLDLYIEQYVNERGSVFITAWWQNGAIAKMRDCFIVLTNDCELITGVKRIKKRAGVSHRLSI